MKNAHIQIKYYVRAETDGQVVIQHIRVAHR